ncbi:MAG: undecaprenyl/decaprenyl-phosphate alpha-N-acetylglucosaminyl 1-phosphate transferase [Candidatus Komeilibacteria bacterium]|nr:undecaprenyl/decaprenyl-phosphate alpha-N-acetylglucosaminyl 1-phosphate transferase [Candidatus Komeilibacteria bacterium]
MTTDINSLWWYLLPVLVSFALAVFFSRLVRRFARRHNIVDQPGPRKVHSSPTPLLGGAAIYMAWVLTLLVFWPYLFDGVISAKHVIGLLIGGGILIVGGYFDDRYNLPPKYQVAFPVLAAITIIISGIGITFITNPLGGYIHFDQVKWLLFWWQGTPYYFTLFTDFFTLLWILGMVYVTKLLDGLDGLATGVGVIGSIIIFIVSLFWDVAQSGTSILSLAFGGAALGFLVWNWHPAKIFLGEGGSTLIGFVLGVLSIISGGKIATALLIMGIPILDVAWVIGRRLFFERKSIAAADAKHIHHRLLQSGFSHRGAVIFLYVITALFGSIAIFSQTEGKIMALVILSVFMVGLAVWLIKRHPVAGS